MNYNDRFFKLFDALKEAGRINSYVQLGEIIATNKAGINDLKNDRKKVTLDNIKSMILSYPDINLNWFITGREEMFISNFNQIDIVADLSSKYDKKHRLQHIPLFRLEATAGITSLFMDDRSQKPVGHIDIPNLPKCDGATYVVGDSMYPLLKSGDIILYKKVGSLTGNIVFGEMYMLDIDLDGDDYITVKYIHRSEIENHIKLVSQNQHHDPIEIPITKVRGLALVKASIRFNTLR